MRRFLSVFISLGLSLAPQALSSSFASDDVDYLDLAALLIRDGKFDRASNTLSQIDPEQGSLDVPRFYFLRGLVRLNLTKFSQAADDFEVAIRERLQRAGKDEETHLDPRWYVYLAQAQFYSDRYEECLDSFSKAGSAAASIRSTFALRGEALKKLERYEEAWDAFNQGLASFPDYKELERRRLFLAIDRKLYRTAAELGRAYLSTSEATERDYLAVGTALYEAGSRDEALEVFELAHLKFRSSAPVSVALSQVYRDLDMYRTAGLILERASLGGPDDLVVQAAELYRRAGEPFRALALNGRVGDARKRLRQRLAILLEIGRYEQVTIMERDLRRVRLLRDEGLRYALAYAFFKTGDYQRADQLLAGVKEPSLFRQATELRKAMTDCRDERWRCS